MKSDWLETKKHWFFKENHNSGLMYYTKYKTKQKTEEEIHTSLRRFELLLLLLMDDGILLLIRGSWTPLCCCWLLWWWWWRLLLLWSEDWASRAEGRFDDDDDDVVDGRLTSRLYRSLLFCLYEKIILNILKSIKKFDWCAILPLYC